MTLSTKLRVERLSEDNVLSLRDEWNAVAGEAPFCRWEWLECWWRHYRPRRGELCVLAVYGEAELIGLAPLYIERTLSGGRVVKFLGSGRVASDYLTILAADANANAVVTVVVEWLLNNTRAWDRIELVGVGERDVRVLQLVKQLADAGLAVHRSSLMSCWQTPLPESWDPLLASLSPSRRQKLRKQQRDLVERGRVTLHAATTPAALERGFAILVELHQRRRESKGDGGCFASPQFLAFHREVMPRLLAEGRLRLRWIETDGRPIAVTYEVTGGDTVFMYQSGIEPDAGDLRPGWLNQACSIRAAIDEGFAAYDFLRGDEPYKASWGTKPIASLEYRVVGRKLSARLRHAAWRVGRSARQWLKSKLKARIPAANPSPAPTSSPSPTPTPADAEKAEAVCR